MKREEWRSAEVAEEQPSAAYVGQPHGNRAVPRDDRKGNVKGRGLTTAQKWERHEEALQQWRKDTESHKLRYQAVQQKYEAYLWEKKVEREGRARGTSG